MRVKTRWPALAPAIRRAGHEPVLVEPLEGEAPVAVGVWKGGEGPDSPRSPPPRKRTA